MAFGFLTMPNSYDAIDSLSFRSLGGVYEFCIFPHWKSRRLFLGSVARYVYKMWNSGSWIVVRLFPRQTPRETFLRDNTICYRIRSRSAISRFIDRFRGQLLHSGTEVLVIFDCVDSFIEYMDTEREDELFCLLDVYPRDRHSTAHEVIDLPVALGKTANGSCFLPVLLGQAVATVLVEPPSVCAVFSRSNNGTSLATELTTFLEACQGK